MNENSFATARLLALAKLKEALEFNEEQAHGIADDVLCDLLKVFGYEDVVEAWEKTPKWYS